VLRVHFLMPAHDGASDESFVLMQWNVLAAPFTHWNSAFHRNGQNQMETRAQTAARYALAGDAVLAQGPDAVCLQECEPAFFDQDVNPTAARLAAMFEVVSCYGPKGTPGTVVLLHQKGALVKAAGVQVRCIHGGKATGGGSKSTICVPVLSRGSKSASLQSAKAEVNVSFDMLSVAFDIFSVSFDMLSVSVDMLNVSFDMFVVSFDLRAFSQQTPMGFSSGCALFT